MTIATGDALQEVLRQRRLARSVVFNLMRQFFSSPAYNRVDSAIGIAQIQLDAMPKNGIAGQCAQKASTNLSAAKRYLSLSEYENSWRALNEAKRFILQGTDDIGALQATATSLRREADSKLSGWRAKAVNDLLCDGNGRLREDIGQRIDHIVEAKKLLDDQFETTNHRIELRRRHLENLFAFLVLTLLGIFALAEFGFLPGRLSDIHQLLAMSAAGILGALISVAQGLMQDKLEQKIPAQVIGAFVVWMRPMIGAAAAVAILIIIGANDALQIFQVKSLSDTRLLLTLGLLAGYSERFLTGTFSRLSDAVGDRK